MRRPDDEGEQGRRRDGTIRVVHEVAITVHTGTDAHRMEA